MSGLIGVIAQETARYSIFAASLTGLKTPPDTEVKWIFGHSIADNTNQLVEAMLLRGDDWLWILGDDHSFSPNMLNRLLAQDVDVIVPLCLMRTPPYGPVIFSGYNAYPEDMRRIPVDLNQHPDGGLIEVHSAGSGGMLIRRNVFDKVEAPRREPGTARCWFEAGQVGPHVLGEDVHFCDKARHAGVKIHCDLDVVLGHCVSGAVWPVREPDGWTFGFSMMGGFEITLPPSFKQYAERVTHGS